MADADTEVTLDELHTAIRDGIAAQFDAFKTVEFYRDDEDEQIPTPACILEMSEAEPQPHANCGTGQWPVLLRFAARIIMPKRTPAVRLEIRKAATALATFLNLRHWPNVNCDEAQVIACEPDEFAPNLDRFAVWRVEWVHLAFLGESAWINLGGVVPTDALYSFAPRIGIPYKDEYVPLDQVTP